MTNWTRSTLGSVAQWSSGGTPRASTAAFYGGDIPWAVIGDLNDGAVSQTAASITQAGLAASSAKLLAPGTLLVAMYGSIGKLGITRIPMATNQAIAAAVPQEVSLEFLFYYLLSQRDALIAAGKGATQKNIGQTVLKSWPIRYPEINEQRQIVEVLGDHLSRLETAEKSLVESISRLAVMRSSILVNAYADVSADTDCMKPLGTLMKPGRKIAYGVLVPGPDISNGVPMVRVGDMATPLVVNSLKRISPEISAKFPRTRLFGGEVLLSVVGTIGRVSVVPPELAGCNVARAVAVLPFKESIYPHFAAGFLMLPAVSRQLGSAAHEVARKTLNLEDVRRVRMPTPAPEMQHAVIDRATEGIERCNRLEKLLATANARSAGLRKAVLSAAFSGRLTGRSSDTEVIEETAERLDRPVQEMLL